MADTTSLSYLSIVKNNIVFATRENEKWRVKNNQNRYFIIDGDISSKLFSYSNLNTIYRLNCEENFAVFGNNNGFVAYWIKEAGTIKFIYYSTMYDTANLNEVDKKKLSSLMEIDSKFGIVPN